MNDRVDLDYYTRPRPDVLRAVPACALRLLDVGCGGGTFGRDLKALRPAIEVWGVEPFAGAAALAARHLDRVLRGPFSLQDIPASHFDVVTFNDSLEHIADHDLALALAHRALRPEGTLIVSVPNVRFYGHLKRYLVDGDWEYEDEGVLDRTHVRFFTKRSIARCIARAGFRVDSIRGLHPCRLSWKHRLLGAVLGERVADMRYLQFLVVASALPCDDGDAARPERAS